MVASLYTVTLGGGGGGGGSYECGFVLKEFGLVRLCIGCTIVLS